jgi:glutamate synthase domain-containing protein 2/glutamate synthase domain-containing protein 1/glutamate synthase domain-containing protein 3
MKVKKSFEDRDMVKIGLYDSRYEHDSCGVGFVGLLSGQARHEVVEMGIQALRNLEHRGALGADSGDGAGILIRIPHEFFARRLEFALPEAGNYALGVAFLSLDKSAAGYGRELIDNHALASGFKVLGWRPVPVHSDSLGETAYKSRPLIWHFFLAPVSGKDSEDSDAFERRLYILRKSIENAALRAGLNAGQIYLTSLSSRTMIYKGMMMARQLEGFYPDLGDKGLASPFAIIHQRYSTNTFPSWRLAQPFRALAHNGEINTIRGNRTWLTAREPNLSSPLFGAEIKKLFPLIEPDASDSASLDNGLEFLIRGGRSLDHSMAMLIPQAWGDKYPMGPNLRGFFEYHAGLMEPWDGPAAVVFTDGLRVGACLDRNGLRPARYSLTRDGLVVFASETGVLDLPAEDISERGALRPGQMLLAEIGDNQLIKNAEIKSRLARLRPYSRWVRENRIDIPGFFSVNTDFTSKVSNLPYLQTLFGYTRDDTDILLNPMASGGAEPVGSMGADIPLAVLEEKPKSLFSFFRQQFAQITNPPIDSIREELVMSQMTFLGNNPNILNEEPGQARLVKLKHPILSNDDLNRLAELKHEDFRSLTLDATFARPDGSGLPGANLAQALDELQAKALQAARSGVRIIVVSDKKASLERLPIPSLLAVAAVNRKLMENGDRVRIGLISETGEAREVAHMAMLLSSGASAINPWLAFETVAGLAMGRELAAQVSPTKAIENYVYALCKGMLKIISKMGISTLRSYRGAQIFEAVGLGPELIDRYFPAIASPVGGIGLRHLENDAVSKGVLAARLLKSEPAASPAPATGKASLPANSQLPGLLPEGGAYRFRAAGRSHLWTPASITLLQRAVREDNYDLYRQYASLINDQAQKAFTLRGLMDFVPGQAAPLDQVEPAENLFRRFVTGAMSFGSLSKEVHETMAKAMNSIGARSNSGEGGEDPWRYLPQPDGVSLRSAIKQVASGRFGVTLEYLVNADEFQIKIAQGAKPGEGGQLPGHKVDSEIARVRHSTPGVTLISPPPHHDIYSIEDIAQLIYDLYQANDRARVSVKLVSETGVGTIAAGAAKAMAGTILISGFDGGTGASPLSSIMYAGSPWETGLAETQQTLVLNNLRGRVRLQADGQMKTGRDVVIAALLGADEYGFGTAALVTMGCIMMRKCHTNGCPVGVATQDPAMRARFAGKPEHLINFFRFLAQDIREIMASLGFGKMEDMIGRVDRLKIKAGSPLPKDRGLDYSALLTAIPGRHQRYMGPKHDVRPGGNTLDDRLLAQVEAAIESGQTLVLESPVHNTDRTVGAKISSRIARSKGMAGLADDSIFLRLHGTAGQSFGAFAAKGLTLRLEGTANDYVGKGLSGGRIIIRPPHNVPAGFLPHKNIIAGNVALYGATAGQLYLHGQAGERFAVRNSGAKAVVEGIGDHGCEYMTGGRVVILGLTGVNFAAGMSGGIAYVYDEDGFFDSRCNLEMVDLDLLEPNDEKELRQLIEDHFLHTASPLARDLLHNWENEKGKFVKVFPMEYRRVLGEMSQADAAIPRRAGETD